MSSELSNYLSEVLSVIIDRAKEARDRSKGTRTEGDMGRRLYAEGRALAYYEVVSTLIGQAEAFGVSKEDVPELDFDPERELLS